MTSKACVYLLPGLLCDETVWRHQIETLSDLYEVRVADFRDLDSIGSMAERVLDQAPERFSVAGHSMGARVAIEIARRAPERVERLALLDTGVHPQKPGEPEQRQVLVDLAYGEGMQALADRWLPPMVHEDRIEDPVLIEPLTAMVLRMSPDIYRRQVTALLGRPDALSHLDAVACPVLVGVGRQDRWSPPAQHDIIVAALPHALYSIFEDSGHMAPVEAPQAVSAALLQWMALDPALTNRLESARA